MKAIVHRLVCLIILAALLAAAPSASAQTDPVGYVTETLHANTTSLIGTRLLPPTVAAGVIDTVTGAVVTDTGVDFSALLDPTLDPAYSLAALVAGPDIVVEQPAGTGLTDNAATLAFGNSAVGVPGTSLTLKIRNTGNADLTGIAASHSARRDRHRDELRR